MVLVPNGPAPCVSLGEQQVPGAFVTPSSTVCPSLFGCPGGNQSHSNSSRPF